MSPGEKVRRCAALAVLVALPDLAGAQALQRTLGTSPAGDAILLDVTNGSALQTVQGTVFQVHLQSTGQTIPVAGVSFLGNRISVALGERLLYDDGHHIRISYTAGTVADGSGNQLPYFRGAFVPNGVAYLYNAPASIASHSLTSRGVVFGVSDWGGGYVSQINVGGVNINVPGYGRGVQSAYRSGLHSNAYNPSQGGVRDNVGTLARARQAASPNGPGGRVVVDPHRIALFAGETVFDHLENESGYVTDNFSGDGGGSDSDGIDEAIACYPDELRSELEYATSWEDASAMTATPLAMVRRSISLRYATLPAAIRCFGENATRANGQPVLEERFRVTDVSPTAIPGPQAASDTDLSFITASFAVRPRLSSGFRFLMWIEEGTNTWAVMDITETSGVLRWKETRNTQLTVLVPPTGRGLVGEGYLSKTGKLHPDFPMVLATNGSDPDSSNAIGLLIPRDLDTNRYNTVRVHAGGNLSHPEDRLIASFVEADVRSSGSNAYIYLRTRSRYTGLLSPDRLSGPGINPPPQGIGEFAPPGAFVGDETEMLRHEVYYFLGTPNQIRQAAAVLSPTAESR